ncbi:MAG: TonB family protein [Bacillota bacterium]
MWSPKKFDRFYVYIGVSLILHLILLYFFPFGSLTGVASEEGNNDRDFGMVQYVEFQPMDRTPEDGDDQQEQIIEEEEEKEDEAEEPEEQEEPESEAEPAEEPEDSEQETEQMEETAEESEQTEERKSEVEEDSVIAGEEESVADNIEDDQQTTEDPVNKGAEADTPSQETSEEILTSEQSETEVEVGDNRASEQEENDSSGPVSESEPEPNSKPETEAESEPAPDPPPTAGDLIGLSPEPVYPKYLVGQQASGTVRLMVTVSTKGEIEEVEVIESSETEEMDRNAVSTVERGWKFRAYQKPYKLEVTVDYSIDDQGNSNVEVNLGELEFD